MAKNNKSRERELYDIDKLISSVKKNTIEQDAYDYNEINMAIFGANVNLKRYICEIRDGLKPVHRRILVAMYESGVRPGKITKSATLVGDVFKKFHPHNTESIYTAMVYLGQPWRNNQILVSSPSNYGSAYEPNGYAAARYTDCSMSEFAYDCFFADWRYTNPKEDMTVDWIPTYDDSNLEPMYLPAKYPLFLLNWHRAMGV